MVNTFLPFCPPQYKKGGPIIAVQVENEYGSYAKDPNYMTYVKMVMVVLLLVSCLLLYLFYLFLCQSLP